jgi:hypothetical protein
MLALGSGTRHADVRPLADLLGFSVRQRRTRSIMRVL